MLNYRRVPSGKLDWNMIPLIPMDSVPMSTMATCLCHIGFLDGITTGHGKVQYKNQRETP